MDSFDYAWTAAYPKESHSSYETAISPTYACIN